MAKVTSKAKFDIISQLDQFIDTDTARRLADTVIEGAKEAIKFGSSPVRGEGRFETYSESYKQTIKRGGIEGKSIRPVNLNASGKMMYSMDYRVKPDSVEIGFFKGEEAKIASYHNEGTPRMPKRQIVPNPGQQWSVSIMTRIKDVYSQRVSDIIKKSNSK